jgi:glutamine amidotransferase
MCRLAIYLGPEISLGEIMTNPEHSLLKQSWQPRELKYAKLNADGYGFGWYSHDGNPLRYAFAEPMWSDPNLHDLCLGLKADLWFGFVRSASEGFGNQAVNTQPFRDNELLFMHNGYVEQFTQTVRRELLHALPHDIQADIMGSTDSEYLFALTRWCRQQSPDSPLTDLLRRVLEWLEPHIDDTRALLNFAVTDGESIACCRAAFNDDSPTLYFIADDEEYPEGAQMIVSEPLHDPELWHPVPEFQMLSLNRDTPPELIAL